MHNEILNTLSPPLLDWFFEMFEYANGSPTASKVVHELLGSNGPFLSSPEILTTNRGARFFRYLGEIEPATAVKTLQKTLGLWSQDTLLKFTEGRRDIIGLLEKTARWRDLFGSSANLLLDLAVAENEVWSNNASGVFAELFSLSRHPSLSLTEAPPTERLIVMEDALGSDSSERRMLALRACDRALRERTFGSVSNEVRVFGRDPNSWVPNTWEDIFETYRKVWGFLLDKADKLPKGEREEAVRILIEHMGYLGRIPSLADLIIDGAYELASKPWIDRGVILRGVVQMLHYFAEIFRLKPSADGKTCGSTLG